MAHSRSVRCWSRLAADRDGALVVSQVKGRARLGLVRGAWSFEPDGPLGFLAGRRPLLSLALHPFRLVFGRRPTTERVTTG